MIEVKGERRAMKHFIPKPYRKEPVSVRIDTEKLEQIDSLARHFHTNRSEFINRCIDYTLGSLKDEDF